MKLSNNFSLEELTASQTALREGIPNTPDKNDLAALTALVENLLQPLRDKLGKGIRITSGYRSPLLNRTIGSTAKASQHMKGEAADIVVSGMTSYDLTQFIIDSGLEFDQLIYEGTWVHISYSTKHNRKQVLTAIFDNGVRYINGLHK